MLINSTIVRKDGGLAPCDKPSKWFRKTYSHIQDRYLDEWGEGILEEAAEVALGGPLKLAKALNDGRVVKGETAAGIQLFYLPRSNVGKRDSFLSNRSAEEILKTRSRI